MELDEFLGLFRGRHFFAAYDYSKKLPSRPGKNSPRLKLSQLEGLNKNGYCIFFAVNSIKGNRRTKPNVRSIRAIWIDDDIPRKVPRTKFPIPPSIVVRTSQQGKKFKHQYYWLTNTRKFDEFELVMQTMIDVHGNDKGVRDLSRVLRLPGYNHNKGKPFPVEVVGGNKKTYQWQVITTAFPPAENKETITSSKGGKFSSSKCMDIISHAKDGMHNAMVSIALSYANRNMKMEEYIGYIMPFKELALQHGDPKRVEHRFSEEHVKECWGNASGIVKDDRVKLAKLPRCNFPKKKRKYVVKRLPVIPDKLIFPDDDYGAFIKNVMEATNHRSNPVASMVHGRAVIAFVSDGYGTKGNSTASGFDIVLGRSRVGKTLTLKSAKRFLPIEAQKTVIRKFKTSEGLEEFFVLHRKRPSVLAFIDEIGMNLNDAKGGKHGDGLSQIILELATNGNDIFTTRLIKEKPVETLYSPRLITSGNTTIAALKGAIERKEVETGATNRQRFFNAEQNVTNKRSSESKEMKKKFIEKMSQIYKYSGKVMENNRCTGYHEVKMTKETDDWIYEYDSRMLNKMDEGSLRGRHTELAVSWVIPRAIWRNHENPVIDLKLFKWGFDIIDYSIRTIEYLYEFELHNEDDTVEAEHKLKQRLSKAGGEMVKREALKFRPYVIWSPMKKNSFLKSLRDLKVIEEVDVTMPSGRIKLMLRLIG